MINQEFIKSKQKNNDHFVLSGIEVFVKDKITNDISAKNVINKLISIIPGKFLSNIKQIHIGTFKELEDREIQAMYDNSRIMVTNDQSSEMDMLDDLVHEVAHSVEEVFWDQIHSNDTIKQEFKKKRQKMWLLLKDLGFELDLKYFLDIEYSERFDMFLYKKVGYKILTSVLSGLFYSPYGATSIREYFANGFEAFFLNQDTDRLKTISPSLYNLFTRMM